MDLSRLSRDDWILAGLALLVAIDLLFLPWWSASVGLGAFSLTTSGTATGAPEGWLGVLALLADLALIAYIALDRLRSARLPTLGGSEATTRFMLASAVAVCLAFKFILHVSFTATYWDLGFWGAVVLTTPLVVLTVRDLQAEGLLTPTRR
jgi:hypothetical protein